MLNKDNHQCRFRLLLRQKMEDREESKRYFHQAGPLSTSSSLEVLRESPEFKSREKKRKDKLEACVSI